MLRPLQLRPRPMPAGIRAAAGVPRETSHFFLHNPRRPIRPCEQCLCLFVADDPFGRRIDRDFLSTEAVADGGVMHEQRAEMASFDVGLIPFKQSDFTRFIYPIKANEYLAAGLPVVMTPFANLTEFDGAVRVAASADEFVSALEDEIRRDSSHRQSTRQAFASMNSWGNRAAQFGSILAHQRPVLLAA